MEPDAVDRLRRVLAGTGWWEAARRLTTAARAATTPGGRLLVVGTPDHLPAHLVAHLDAAAPAAGLPRPTLVSRARRSEPLHRGPVTWRRCRC